MNINYCWSLLFGLILWLGCQREDNLLPADIDLTPYLGNYCVTCEGNQFLYLSDSTDVRIKFDTIFQDIMTVRDSQWIDYRGEKVISVNTNIKQYPYITRAPYGGNSHFAVLGYHQDSIHFDFPLDFYMCKCGAALSIEGDSISYFVSNQWSSESYIFWCNGLKK